MEFAEVVRRRRMVRDYDPNRPVPTEVVDRLLAHAVRAPSAGFSQGWAFLVLSERADRDLFWSAATPPAIPAGTDLSTSGSAGHQPSIGGPASRQSPWLTGMRRAPLVIVPMSSSAAYLDRYAEPDKGWTDRDESRWPVPYWHIDAGFAALLILLTSVDEGLGACFFGIPAGRIAVFRDAFGVPDDYEPVGAITVGYRSPDRPSPSLSRGRRPIEQVVHHGRWHGSAGNQVAGS